MTSEIIVRNMLVRLDPIECLTRIRSQLSNGRLEQFAISGENIKVTCPFHADGHEKRPSAYINLTNESVPLLWFHCFTCSTHGPFSKFVGACFGRSEKFGEDWLIDNYSTREQVEEQTFIKEFKLPSDSHKVQTMDDSSLDRFVSYHPYMTQRKLTRDVIERFEIKYDPETKSIIFPVRDLNGNLKFLTRRSVETKSFLIDKGAEKKDIYLLNVANDYPEVYVCESQINALTLWGWGYPAVALFGAGCPKDQIEQLNRSGISHFILALDNDPAGHKGTKKLCSNLSDNKFVDVVRFTDQRDVNDLTKEEFDKLERIDRYGL